VSLFFRFGVGQLLRKGLVVLDKLGLLHLGEVDDDVEDFFAVHDSEFEV